MLESQLQLAQQADEGMRMLQTSRSLPSSDMHMQVFTIEVKLESKRLVSHEPCGEIANPSSDSLEA